MPVVGLFNENPEFDANKFGRANAGAKLIDRASGEAIFG
jgi:hypothetical protein